MADPCPLAILILAAGKATRMKSRIPKVLHEVCGRPMLGHLLAAVAAAAPSRSLVVIGHAEQALRERFSAGVEFVVQGELRGTGHAVLQCRGALEGFRGDVLILYADTPLLRGETLTRMQRHRAETGADLVMLSAKVDVPGIVLRDTAGAVERIVDAADATPEQLGVTERNTGVYLLSADLLWKLLAQVGDDNAQGEIYLTDIIELAVRERLSVEALWLDDPEEAIGVNSRSELAAASAAMTRRILNRHMQAGVTFLDPASTLVDVDVEIGADTLIEPGCVIHGPTKIGEGVHLKPHCIGNFVEVKNSVLGEGVKADHLSYIGDADVGSRASFGCGSVVVNYDGQEKHRTTIGERAFIGCNVNLIAPITIEPDAFLAAGSTITKDVPAGALAVARERQRNVTGWVARRRKRD